MRQHEILEWHLSLGDGFLGDHLLIQVRLQGILVHPIEHRRHDEHGQEQRHACENLVRRRLLQAQGLTQDGEDDDDAGEAGHQDDERWNEAQRSHDQQDLQADRILLLAVRPIGQRDGRDRQRIGGQGQWRCQQQQQRQHHAQCAHHDLPF
ncbi:hypothetical protein D3C80_392590 [compost metagenome]